MTKIVQNKPIVGNLENQPSLVEDEKLLCEFFALLLEWYTAELLQSKADQKRLFIENLYIDPK